MQSTLQESERRQSTSHVAFEQLTPMPSERVATKVHSAPSSQRRVPVVRSLSTEQVVPEPVQVRSQPFMQV